MQAVEGGPGFGAALAELDDHLPSELADRLEAPDKMRAPALPDQRARFGVEEARHAPRCFVGEERAGSHRAHAPDVHELPERLVAELILFPVVTSPHSLRLSSHSESRRKLPRHGHIS